MTTVTETTSSDQSAVRSTGRLVTLGLFILVLCLHVFLVSKNWGQGLLPGHEFRQTQTALSILFIQKDNDFSLAYPTPLLGPPWSIPMEFPLYQWTAALLAQQTGWSVPVSARAVSLTCFYLCLPALFLLLKEGHFRVITRVQVLTLVLTTPIYIFYTRAVLIESMALMFSLWFVYGFVRMGRGRSWYWMGFAALTAALAALVKVTTMMAWCIGPAIGGLWWSWQLWKTEGWGAWRKSVLLGVGCAAPAGIASFWWLRTADTIKATSPGGKLLTSDSLTDFNLGQWSDRIDPETWRAMLHHVSAGVTPLGVLLGALLIGIVAAIHLKKLRGLTAPFWFAGVLLLFPVLYRIHDYYFYAIAILAAISVGAAIQYLAQLARRDWIGTGLVALVAMSQLQAYLSAYYEGQTVVSNGGSQVDFMIRDVTEPDDVIIVMGNSWSASTAYYSGRRCFMIREVMMHDPDESLRELESLDRERVAGLVTMGYRRGNDDMIGRITRRFALDSVPTAAGPNADFYVARTARQSFLRHMALYPQYGDLQSVEKPPPPLPALNDPTLGDQQIHPVSANQNEALFAGFAPGPTKYRAQFGFSSEFAENRFVTGAHPDCDLWVYVPHAAKRVNFSFGIREGAYKNPAASTDGVEFVISGITPDSGEETVLFRRFLDPAKIETDRGTVFETLTLPEPVPVELMFSARPGPHANYAFDWAYWDQVEVH